MSFVAGAVGIEPTQMVLETTVLPLYDAPTPLIIANPAWLAGSTTWFLYAPASYGSACNIS